MLGYFGFIAIIAMIGAYFSVCRSALFHAFHDDKLAEEYAMKAYSQYTYPSPERAEKAREYALWWAHKDNFPSKSYAKKLLHSYLRYFAGLESQ